MTLFSKAATAFAAVFGMGALLGTSTPGFAFEFDRPINAVQTVPVPPLVVSATPAPAASLPDRPASPANPQIVSATVEATTPAQDDASYASLAAAVAAQDMPSAADAELTCMAGAVYFEAKGEPLAGQLAVANVIMNRAKSGRFPKSVCSVVTQRGQFSFVRGGRIPPVAANAMYRTAMAVAQVALADGWESQASNALFFHARRVSPGWRMTKVASIGNHIFYR